MKRIGTFFVCAALVSLLTPETQAGGTENSITITSVNPSVGEVVVDGESTLAEGYSQAGILLIVRPAGGNEGEGGQGEVSSGPGSFSAPVSVPTGQYDVQAVLLAVDSCGNVHYFY